MKRNRRVPRLARYPESRLAYLVTLCCEALMLMLGAVVLGIALVLLVSCGSALVRETATWWALP